MWEPPGKGGGLKPVPIPLGPRASGSPPVASAEGAEDDEWKVSGMLLPWPLPC